MSGFDDIEQDRVYPRETLHTSAEIMVDEQWHDCSLVNISPTGARLHISLQVERGKDAVIKLGEYGKFKATVAWCHDGEVGVKFDHDPAEMTRVLIEMELHSG